MDSAHPCRPQGPRGARPATQNRRNPYRVPTGLGTGTPPALGYKSGASQEEGTIRIFEDLKRTLRSPSPFLPEVQVLMMEPQYDEARAFQVAREHAVEVRRACRDALELKGIGIMTNRRKTSRRRTKRRRQKVERTKK